MICGRLALDYGLALTGTLEPWRKSRMMDTQPRNLSARHLRTHPSRHCFPTWIESHDRHSEKERLAVVESIERCCCWSQWPALPQR